MSDKFTVIFIKAFVALLVTLISIYFFFEKEILYNFKKKEVLDKISYQFFDKKSVEFRNVSFKDNILMCGEVNGKNRYGAYVGFKKFYVVVSNVKDKLDITVEDGSDFSKGMIHGMCENKK